MWIPVYIITSIKSSNICLRCNYRCHIRRSCEMTSYSVYRKTGDAAISEYKYPLHKHYQYIILLCHLSVSHFCTPSVLCVNNLHWRIHIWLFLWYWRIHIWLFLWYCQHIYSDKLNHPLNNILVTNLDSLYYDDMYDNQYRRNVFEHCAIWWPFNRMTYIET